MTKFIVNGGKKLQGDVNISGSKNAALPIICACLLSEEEIVLENVPNIADIHSMIAILQALGAEVAFESNTLIIRAQSLSPSSIPEELVQKMRASILILGPLLHRFEEVKMAFPGGCVLGKRSVHAHTHAFKELGCEIIDSTKGLHLRAGNLAGKCVILPEMSVTATENAIMAAVLTPGKTEIRMSAMEPHVQDMCHFLNKIGAKISGIGTPNVRIEGVEKLQGGRHRITGDYLEAGTFAIAAAATHGDVTIHGIDPSHLDILWQALGELGVDLQINEDSVQVQASGDFQAIKMLRTAVYPSFPTDLQAPFTILLTQAKGVSKVFETLFEGRLNYLFELEMMGAHVELMNPHQAIVIGPTPLKGMPISSYDIRAGAAMVIAALIASGETEISNINYIDRGYEKLDQKLRDLGAEIIRIPNEPSHPHQSVKSAESVPAKVSA